MSKTIVAFRSFVGVDLHKTTVTLVAVGPDGTEIARGICNFSQPELDHIKGHHSNEVAALLGHEGYEEVVHRNRLVLTAD